MLISTYKHRIRHLAPYFPTVYGTTAQSSSTSIFLLTSEVHPEDYRRLCGLWCRWARLSWVNRTLEPIPTKPVIS